MKSIFYWSVLLILLTCLSGCFQRKPLPDPEWSSKPAAIEFQCRADNLLNEYDGRAHTLLLIVYQLREPDFFTKLAKDKDGLKRLLRFETVQERLAGAQNNVAACHRFIITPGEEKKISLDRLEGVKGVGIVAGYYHLNPDRVSHYWELPVAYERQGLFLWKVEAEVGLLSVDLNFGSHELLIQSGLNERNNE